MEGGREGGRGKGGGIGEKSANMFTCTFHPLPTIVIHTFNFAQVQSMDDNCGERVECMGVASGCG